MKKNRKLLHCSIVKLLIGLLFAVLILPSIAPLFRKDFFQMHDYTHVARLVELDKAVKDGHIPPIWSKNLGWGYGMPLFHFYAPLPYYIAEVFHLSGFSFLNSIKIIFGLTFFISFIGMFLFAKKFWGKWGGFLSALAFVYSPYRAVDFYVRGALGELFAIALIPWVLWGITEVIDKTPKSQNSKTPRVKIIICSLLLALFFLSHTVLSLIGLPFFILFALFYCFINKNFKKSFLRLVLTFSLGLGLSAFFLMPAFFEKGFTQVDKLAGGYSHYSHHFLYFRQFWQGTWGYGGSVGGIDDGISFHLGKIHLFLVCLTLIFTYFITTFSKKIEKKTCLIIFLTFLGLILAFLTTYHSEFIWDAIPFMAYIQFPWRLNSFIIVLVAFLVGGVAYYLKRFNKKLSFIFITGAILLLLKTNLGYFKPEKYSNPDDHYYTDKERIQKSMSGVIPDFIPIWVEKNPSELPQGEYEIIEGDSLIKVKESKTQKLVLETKTEKFAKLQINRFYFPGWKVFINKKEAEIDYKNPHGLIVFDLPEGDLNIEVKLTKTLVQNLAELFTVFSIIVFIVIYVV